MRQHHNDIFAVLSRHADAEGRIVMSLRSLAAQSGWSRSQCALTLHEFLATGVITIVSPSRGPDRPTTYQIAHEER